MPRLPLIDLTVGSSAVTPRAVLVKQADFCHEAAVITVARTLLPYGGREEDLPVTFRWGNDPGVVSTFYGYVHHTVPFYDTGDIDKVQLICLGASSVLSEPFLQSWTNRTADSVARELVERTHLSFDYEPHPKVWPFLSSTGTAWESLIELAGKVGFILSAHGTEVRFLSPTTLFQRYGSRAPVMAVGTGTTRFRPELGTKDSVRTRVLFGMNQRDGSQFAATEIGLGNRQLGTERRSAGVQMVSAVTDSPGDGADKLTGLALRDQFPYQATAESYGDAFFFAGQTVYVTGVEQTQTGHWYVEAVEHDLRLQPNPSYICYLTLGRDALGPYAVDGNQHTVLSIQRQTPLGDLTTVPPPTVQVNGQWRSAWGRRVS